MKRKGAKTLGKLLVVVFLVGASTLLGLSLPGAGPHSKEAQAYKWSAYANVYVNVGPSGSIGANAYVYLWDGNGRYYGCRKTSGTWGGHQVSFGSVYIDKPLKIKVRFDDGKVMWYYPSALRPWGPDRVINVSYFGGCSG